MGALQAYYVISPDLQYGNGTRAKDLEDLKKKLIKRTRAGDWTLVISIHGGIDPKTHISVISIKGGNRNKNDPGVYYKDDIKRIFLDDSTFVQWKAKYGPNYVALNGCQVGQEFEQMLLKALLKPSSKQKAIGLGPRCRPATTMFDLHDANGNRVSNRQQWKKLPSSIKSDSLIELRKLNTKYGYFGAKSVTATKRQLLHYYFEEEPFGSWPVVTISLDYKDTDISFFKRRIDARFQKYCPTHKKYLKGRKSSAPKI